MNVFFIFIRIRHHLAIEPCGRKGRFTEHEAGSHPMHRQESLKARSRFYTQHHLNHIRMSSSSSYSRMPIPESWPKCELHEGMRSTPQDILSQESPSMLLMTARQRTDREIIVDGNTRPASGVIAVRMRCDQRGSIIRYRLPLYFAREPTMVA